ncbi:MAG: hypothetical protein JSV96_04030 [Candidatus Aminicenantes bacterium]|nr:MAG: hypothetical protein JSV96_04030 [Candidatus Aminicenantes bacterium]
MNASSGDFHLQGGSPCIDAGNDSAPDVPYIDFELNPRPYDGDGDGIDTIDIGAYEYIPSYQPMASFVVEKAKIDFKKKNGEEKIHVKGRFELGNGNGVDISEIVIVTIGLFTEEISMYSKGKGNKWEYKRDKGGNGIKHMEIHWKGSEAKFDIHVDKVDLGEMSSWVNPEPVVTIIIQIGDDLGTEDITMRVHKHHLDYH